MSLESWQAFWRLPALFALVVMIFFLLFFKDEKIDHQILKK